MQAAINELENKHKTYSHKSASEESKMIKEIETLKASLPKAKHFSTLKPKADKLYAEKKVLLEQVKGFKSSLDAQNEEIEKLRKEMETIKENQQDVKGEADKVSKDIDKLTQDLSNLFDKKDQRREDYWHARYDYEIQREEIVHIEWMQKQKERVINRTAEAKQLEEERENYIKSLPHPYEKELGTCEHIINYLHEMKRKAGLIQDSEVVARDVQTNFMSEQAKQNLEKKVQAGQIQHAKSKQERDAEEMVRIGGGKKKGKKPKQQAVEEYEFNVDIMVIQKFGLIQISPPINLDEIDSKVAEIQKKQAWYNENGVHKMKETIEELRRQNEQIAKEETKNKDEADDGVVFESRGRGRGRGGRGGGGRGRGGFEDRGRGRGSGRGRQDFRIKSEFEGDSDDDYAAPTQTKTQQNKRKQKAEDLKVDDDNYPTL